MTRSQHMRAERSQRSEPGQSLSHEDNRQLNKIYFFELKQTKRNKTNEVFGNGLAIVAQVIEERARVGKTRDAMECEARDGRDG